jgi:carboxypeptidase C (cathepsin A)
MRFFAFATLVGAIVANNCVYDTNDQSVTSLPYFTIYETLPCSYAGTLPSNADETHHMFYWMYTAKDADAPVAIWLNGGPGASSTFANFLLNGPMRITKTGSSQNDYQVSLAEEGSWVDSAHMVYVDQPVGTGFSWGEPLLTNMDEAADEFVNFMSNFFDMYPQFVGKDLYLTGESYGGKYLPRYSYALLQANKQLDTTRYNLKATLIGDPYAAPLSQRTRMHLVPEALNVLDDSNMA